jgi:hypothetical protein
MPHPARPALLGSFAFLLAAGGFVVGRASVKFWPEARPSPRASVIPATMPVTTLAVPPAPTPVPTLPPVLAAMEAAKTPTGHPPAPDPVVPAPEPRLPPLSSPAPVAVEAPRRRPTRTPPSAAAAASPAPAPPASLPPLPPPPPSRRFVQGTTVTESLKGVKGNLRGFDTSSAGVRRAPEVMGHLDVEMTPEEVRPGESYAVRIFLANEGRKTIQLDSLNVAVVADGRRTARGLAPRTREIAPRERVLLAELPGVWREGLDTWSVEVNATSTRQDSYRNHLRLQ